MGQAPGCYLNRTKAPAPTIGCPECAELLGLSVDHFRRTIESYFARGMPAPLPGPGQRRFDRAKWLAWRNGYTALTPANDAMAQPDPAGLEQQRAHLQQIYATARPARLTGT